MTVKYYSSNALILFTFCHSLCCGIPLLLGTSSIFTNIILFETLSSNEEFFETIEIYLFFITTFIFLLLISLKLLSKIKKNEEDDCECCEEDKNNIINKKIKFNITIASLVYILNSSILLSEFIT